MIEPKDLLRPGAFALGLVAVGALGFAAGYLVARDPQRLRQIARAVAGGAERLGAALAETREEIGDLWAEARDQARGDIDAAAFAAAGGAVAGAAHAAPDAAGDADAAATTAPASAAQGGPRPTRRRAARTARGAKPAATIG